MLLKFIAWLIVGWLSFLLLSQLIKLVPLFLFLLASFGAICSIYSLLPPHFRVPAIEKWLKLDPQLIASPAGSTAPAGKTRQIDEILVLKAFDR